MKVRVKTVTKRVSTFHFPQKSGPASRSCCYAHALPLFLALLVFPKKKWVHSTPLSFVFHKGAGIIGFRAAIRATAPRIIISAFRRSVWTALTRLVLNDCRP